MDVGIFDHFDRSEPLSLSAFYDMRLRLTEAYDRAGFYSYHLSEHHFTPLGLAPSPNVFLAAVAQRTSRLRFGPLVYALPLHNPLRLMEEICMLDQISHGRLDMGFGRGSSTIEAAYYGEVNAQKIYSEGLELILAGLTQEKLDFSGEIFNCRDVPIQLEPYQKPHPPLWYGVHSVESSERAARQGINLVSADSAAETRAFVDRYRAIWDDTRPGSPLPKLGLMRFVYVARDDETAMTVARRAYLSWHRSFHYLFRMHGTVPRLGERAATFDEVCATGKGIAGSPRTVLRFLRDELSNAQANYFVGQFAFGDMTADEALDSIELFRREVMPEIRQMDDATAAAAARV